MSFFTSDYNCKMVLLQYLKRNEKPKVLLILYLISLSECQLQQENNHTQKLWYTKLLQVELARNRCQYEYSAKERTDIYRHIFYRGALASISTTPLGQHMHIKLTLSCKFKLTQEIILSKSPIFILLKCFLCVTSNNTPANISPYTVSI